MRIYFSPNLRRLMAVVPDEGMSQCFKGRPTGIYSDLGK